jgi:hypothetical protein
MHFLLDHLVSKKSFISFINSLFFLVSQNQKSSTSKLRNDENLPVDNFRRRESSSWLLQSEKQKHRPFSEQIDNNRSNRIRTLSDESELFKNRQQPTTIG